MPLFETCTPGRWNNFSNRFEQKLMLSYFITRNWLDRPRAVLQTVQFYFETSTFRSWLRSMSWAALRLYWDGHLCFFHYKIWTISDLYFEMQQRHHDRRLISSLLQYNVHVWPLFTYSASIWTKLLLFMGFTNITKVPFKMRDTNCKIMKYIC